MRRLHVCIYTVISVLLIGGIELIPTSAYGVRLYTNGSSMVMHNDKVSYDDNYDNDINNDDDDDFVMTMIIWFLVIVISMIIVYSVYPS
jgi:hypothetical protein